MKKPLWSSAPAMVSANTRNTRRTERQLIYYYTIDMSSPPTECGKPSTILQAFFRYNSALFMTNNSSTCSLAGCASHILHRQHEICILVYYTRLRTVYKLGRNLIVLTHKHSPLPPPCRPPKGLTFSIHRFFHPLNHHLIMT